MTAHSSHYPRDLVGYGQNVPQAQWPNKAKVAINFVLNYDITTRREIQIVDMASSAKTTFLGKIFQIQTRFMQPYKVYMESDLKKMILDILVTWNHRK